MSQDISADIPSRRLNFPPGFDVSWAGPSPLANGFCLGSENGLLQFFDAEFRPIGAPFKASASGEAINSVVRAGTWLAVSTRHEINFIGKESLDGKLGSFQTSFGAHHLAVTPSGYFIAALGRQGILFASAHLTKGNFVITNPGPQAGLYVYRLIAVPGSGGKDLIVSAGRTGGISFGQWHESQTTTKMNTMSFAGLDVVDVCSIATAEHPRAIAALGKDGTIMLTRDILGNEKPGTLKFVTITGAAYRIVCRRGHLFILSSHGLFGLWNLAESFFQGMLTAKSETNILMMPMEATDINVALDHLILIVGLDHFEVIDVDGIQSENGCTVRGMPEIFSPDWMSSGISQTAKEVALSA
ncbi:MAG: hypothetical protein HY289_12735 [Planctomycetes bacterium]|nr:hypothetical protein [Planctomycetota bacterium]